MDDAGGSQGVRAREAPRVEADFRVRYPTLDELVVAYCADLSRGGLFLATDRFLPVNAVVRLHLELLEGSADIPIISRVAYVRGAEEASASGKPAGMGVEFLDLSEECLELIEAFISERMNDSLATAAPTRLRRLSLLVVDDDVTWQRTAAAPFRARGDYVRLAADGFEALALCLKEPPDLILSDVNMPRMDGWQLLRVIRARPSLSSIPFVFTTTLSGEDERLRGYQLGVDDYLAKPYPPAELQARVDRLATRVQQSSQALAARKTLRGDLAQVGLPAVLAFLELERKTGQLFIAGERAGRIYLRHGRPARIELDEAPPGSSPRELLFELLDWSSGLFEFAPQDVGEGDELDEPLTALLLDHARLRDEASR